MARHSAKPFGRFRELRPIARTPGAHACAVVRSASIATAGLSPRQCGESGVNIGTMLRSLRKPIALIAAYSIALQILFSGFAIGPHEVSGLRGVFDSLGIFCGSKNTGDAPPHQHDNGCGACPFACGGASVLAVPPGGKPALPPLADQAVASPFLIAMPPVPTKHRPQTPRAPPTDA
jgi:hypothetical protein